MNKYIRSVLLALFSIVLGWSSFTLYKGYKAKKEAETRIQTLPWAEFADFEGKPVNLHDFDNNLPLIIIYFHSECEHCVYEAQEIGQNAVAFNNCQVVMITADDSISRVESFCQRHYLWELENLEVLTDNNNRFKNTFDKAVVPSVFIYGKDRKLKKQFLGETKPEAIIMEIQNL